MFLRGKPYIKAELNGVSSSFLLDTGMSDGLWGVKEDSVSVADYGYYEDYLGMTVSGEIFGRRSKIKSLVLAGETFQNVKISYPYEKTLPMELKDFSRRAGSLGGELLKRFSVVLDYGREKMYLKANSHLDDPFHYNKSGLVLRQDGDVVDENKNRELFKQLESKNFISYVDLSYLLSPEFIIDNVREGSPAEVAGILKGDVLLEVNGNKTYRYTLKSINALFYGKEESLVRFKLVRRGKVMYREFVLKSPLKKML